MTDPAGMRHVLAADRIVVMTLLLVHAGATAVLAGAVWVVQLVVYPSFRTVGPTGAWPAVHAAHTRAITVVVGPPWAVQGGTLLALLLRHGLTPLLVLAGALAASTVAVTVLVSVPLHERLGRSYDDATARRLVSTNWLRTAAWTAGTVCALVLVARPPS